MKLPIKNCCLSKRQICLPGKRINPLFCFKNIPQNSMSISSFVWFLEDFQIMNNNTTILVLCRFIFICSSRSGSNTPFISLMKYYSTKIIQLHPAKPSKSPQISFKTNAGCSSALTTKHSPKCISISVISTTNCFFCNISS